jgi:hypothetical protein
MFWKNSNHFALMPILYQKKDKTTEIGINCAMQWVGSRHMLMDEQIAIFVASWAAQGQVPSTLRCEVLASQWWLWSTSTSLC